MIRARPRCPTSAPTCDAIHGSRAAKLPMTQPWTAKTTAVARRARIAARGRDVGVAATAVLIWWRLPPMSESIERLAHAVLLPAVAGLETSGLVPLLERGCRAVLLGETRAEYLARKMS